MGSSWLSLGGRVIGGIVVAAVIVLAGMQIGALVAQPRGAAGLAGELHQIHTASGLYVGTVTREDGDYIRLAAASIITPVEGDEGQYRVQPLAAEPYSASGEVLIAREQVVLVASVASDSELAAAYDEVFGE